MTVAACIDSGPHRFEPRYDVKQRTEVKSVGASGFAGRDEQTPLLEDRIYIHDICTKCGAVLKR